MFCQNLSLFAKLFLDNKSVFFDVGSFNYFLLVYTPPWKPMETGTKMAPPPQVTGFFSKEKLSWDNNNLACILVFPPWQRKGLGALLMGVSYEISRREGILGGPEKPISDLGKKGYKRFWSGEIARWILGLDLGPTRAGREVVIEVRDVSRGTWIAPEDCLSVLREMGAVEEAGMGPGKAGRKGGVRGRVEGGGGGEEGGGGDEEVRIKGDGEGEGESKESEEVKGGGGGGGGEMERKPVTRVKLDKEAVRRYVVTHRISLERACDCDGFVEGYGMKGGGEEEEGEEGEDEEADGEGEEEEEEGA